MTYAVRLYRKAPPPENALLVTVRVEARDRARALDAANAAIVERGGMVLAFLTVEEARARKLKRV